MIQNGQWVQAALILMQLSSVKAEAGRERLFDSIKMSHKVCLIEFAAVIIFLL